MSKRPDFAADLHDVNEDVSQNVNTILSVVKERASQRRSSPPAVASPPAAAEHSSPAATPRPSRMSLPRKAPRPREQSRDMSLVNVTTRIARDTKELLAEAALRQKLAKATPDTEQAIIEEALQQWFKRSGYKLKDGVPEAPPASDSELAEQGC